MKPTLTILIGAPLEGEEAKFLRTLRTDLDGIDGLILANFTVEGRPGVRRQIDFFVVAPSGAAILELKNFSLPILGGENGDWEYLNAAGRRVVYDGGNPFDQTLQQKYALSDAMKRYQQRHPAVPAPQKAAFYSDFAAFVCIYPEIHPDSSVTKGDYRVRVRSYAEVLSDLRRTPDPGRPSNWSAAVWRQFAEGQLRLKVTTLDEATDPTIAAAGATVRAYRNSVEATLRTGLGPLAGDSNSSDYGPSLIEGALAPRNVLLLGPSGSAKSFHLQHLALAACERTAELPILIEAKRYRGADFWNVVRQGAAPFFASDPRTLLGAARLCGLRPLLLVDALNECSQIPELLRGIQAFVVQYGGRVVFTSQQDLELGGELTATVKRLPLPDAHTKRAIYAYHAGIPVTAELDAFCQGFTNAYDLTIAGRLHRSAGTPSSRMDLYDRYVRACLPKGATLATALLRRLARQMADAFSMICTRDEFERTAEAFIVEQNASLALLDDLMNCRLVRVGDGFMTFEHELLFNYFTAEELRRRVTDGAELARELKRPRNRHLLEFVIPRYADRADIARLLAAAHDVTTLSAVCNGHCGALARSVLIDECATLMDAATADLSQLSVTINSFEDEEGRRRIGTVSVESGRRWTSYDSLLCHVIALNLRIPTLVVRFLELLDVTTWRLRTAAEAAARRERFKPSRVWEEVVRMYGGGLQSSAVTLPLTTILADLRSAVQMYPYQYPAGLPIRNELAQRAKGDQANDVALLAVLGDRHRETTDAADILTSLDLVRVGLQSRLYIVRVEAFERLQSMNTAIREACPDQIPRVQEMIRSCETNNLFENTLWAETLAAYDGLEQVVTPEAALDEMRALITPGVATDPKVMEAAQLVGVPPDQFVSNRAAGALSRIFEDVFQGAYWEAYGLLSDVEKHRILCLAGQFESGFLTDWLLAELLRYDAATALPVYERFAAGLDSATPFQQQAVACFVMGIEGCARWSAVSPPYLRGDSTEHQAWALFGAILFWRARGTREGVDEERVTQLWRRLDGQLLLAAGDVLFQLSRSGWRLREGPSPAESLIREYPSATLRIVQACIRQRDRLLSIFPTFPTTNRDAYRFFIRTLGDLAEPSSLPLLREFVEDAELGEDAINAIAAIRKATNGLRAGG